MNDPNISIFIDCRKAGRFLGEAIESVLSQTRTDLELILCEDGSSDLSIPKSDPRVRAIFASTPDFVACASTALAQARGRYFGWIEPDAILMPTALAETSAALDRSANVGMVYTDYDMIDTAGKVLGRGKKCATAYSREGLLVDFMTSQFRLIRRDVLKRIGGVRGGFSLAEDYDVCLRLSEAAIVSRIRRPLYRKRIRPVMAFKSRVIQTESSRRAVEEAMQRRGLADQWELSVEYRGKFFLIDLSKEKLGG